MRLVDADELLKHAYDSGLWKDAEKGFHQRVVDVEVIEDAPTVDLVVHAHNLNKDYPSLFKCSNCGWSDDDTYTGDTDTYNYCPHCGARMDEVEE